GDTCRLGAGYRPAHRTSAAQRVVRAQLAVREALCTRGPGTSTWCGPCCGRMGCACRVAGRRRLRSVEVGACLMQSADPRVDPVEPWWEPRRRLVIDEIRRLVRIDDGEVLPVDQLLELWSDECLVGFEAHGLFPPDPTCVTAIR